MTFSIYENINDLGVYMDDNKTLYEMEDSVEEKDSDDDQYEKVCFLC